MYYVDFYRGGVKFSSYSTHSRRSAREKLDFDMVTGEFKDGDKLLLTNDDVAVERWTLLDGGWVDGDDTQPDIEL